MASFLLALGFRVFFGGRDSTIYGHEFRILGDVAVFS
jgi:hypothetical protein